MRDAAPFRVFRIRLPRHCASTREQWFEHRLRGLSGSLLRRTFHHPSAYGRSPLQAHAPLCGALSARRAGGPCACSRTWPLFPPISGASSLVAIGRSVPLQAQFFFMPPDGAFGLLATVFRTRAPVTASGSQPAGLAPAVRATACFYPVRPALPFARPVSRLCSWPGCPHGGDGLACAPLCGLSPAGISLA